MVWYICVLAFLDRNLTNVLNAVFREYVYMVQLVKSVCDFCGRFPNIKRNILVLSKRYNNFFFVLACSVSIWPTTVGLSMILNHYVIWFDYLVCVLVFKSNRPSANYRFFSFGYFLFSTHFALIIVFFSFCFLWIKRKNILQSGSRLIQNERSNCLNYIFKYIFDIYQMITFTGFSHCTAFVFMVVVIFSSSNFN